MAAEPGDPADLRKLSVRHLLLLTPWIGLVVGASQPIRDNSFLWHVRAGELQLSAGEVLREDPFSYTFAGEPWRTQSWIADLLYGVLEEAFGGLGWVPWLLITAGAATLALVAITTYRRARSPLAVVAALVVLLWLGLPNLVPRPVLFSFVLLALLALTLDTRTLWPVPLILWVWAGLHGSFVLGLGLVALDALRRRTPAKHAVPLVGVSVMMTTLTAHGLGVWAMLAAFIANRGALSFITEWAAPDLLSLVGAPYVLVMTALFFAAARGRLRTSDLWVVVPFMMFGLTSARAIMPATIVLVPYAVTGWPVRDREPVVVGQGSAAVNWSIAAALVFLPLMTSMGFKGIDDTRFPVEATEYLVDGPVWHDDATGGYLIYAERMPVFIDDRAELYGEEFFGDFVETRAGAPVWRDMFARYDIGQAVVRRGGGLSRALEDDGWGIAYSDDDWQVFRRG